MLYTRWSMVSDRSTSLRVNDQTLTNILRPSARLADRFILKISASRMRGATPAMQTA
jgi:hypothetical protein